MAEDKINPPAQIRAACPAEKSTSSSSYNKSRKNCDGDSARLVHFEPDTELGAPETCAPDPRFGDKVKHALEAEAFRRAHDGIEDPVVYQGRFVYLNGPDGEPLLDADGNPRLAKLRKYSDTLLMFLMKAAMPEKYRERHQVPQDGVVLLHVDTGIEGAPGSAAE